MRGLHGKYQGSGSLTYLAVDLLSEGGQSLSYKVQLVQVQGVQSPHLHAHSYFRSFFPFAGLPQTLQAQCYGITCQQKRPDKPICCHFWTVDWSLEMRTMQVEAPHLV